MIRKRMRAKLREIKQQLRERMHDPVRQTGSSTIFHLLWWLTL
jgi:hypothetical protein